MLPLAVLDGATAISFSDLSSVLSALTAQFSVTTAIAVIAGVLGVTVGLAFMWWGARYVTRKIWAALKSGKITV